MPSASSDDDRMLPVSVTMSAPASTPSSPSASVPLAATSAAAVAGRASSAFLTCRSCASARARQRDHGGRRERRGAGLRRSSEGRSSALAQACEDGDGRAEQCHAARAGGGDRAPEHRALPRGVRGDAARARVGDELDGVAEPLQHRGHLCASSSASRRCSWICSSSWARCAVGQCRGGHLQLLEVSACVERQLRFGHEAALPESGWCRRRARTPTTRSGSSRALRDRSRAGGRSVGGVPGPRRPTSCRWHPRPGAGSGGDRRCPRWRPGRAPRARARSRARSGLVLRAAPARRGRARPCGAVLPPTSSPCAARYLAMQGHGMSERRDFPRPRVGPREAYSSPSSATSPGARARAPGRRSGPRRATTPDGPHRWSRAAAHPAPVVPHTATRSCSSRPANDTRCSSSPEQPHRARLDAELLAQLAHDRIRRRLARIDAAARRAHEHAARAGLGRARDEQRAVRATHDGDRDRPAGVGWASQHLQLGERRELLHEPAAVRRPHPRVHRARLGVLATTGEHRLLRRQLADRDRAHRGRVRVRELAVELLVVLAVVADEQPLDVGELAREPAAAASACAPCRSGRSGRAWGPSRSAACCRRGRGCARGTG